MDHVGQYHFAVPPEQVWGAIERMDQFEGWWAWLGGFEVQGQGLHEGSVLRGVVRPPVPYRMSVEVELQRCVRCRLVDACVRGDLVGDAHLRLEAGPDATLASVAWSLEMRQLPMRIAARVAYPLLRFGHDRVVEATVSAFERQLGEHQGAPSRLSAL